MSVNLASAEYINSIMSNVYIKKLQVLNQLKLTLAKAESLAEELHSIEEREGDKQYADEAYGYYVTELGELQVSVEGEMEAIEAMVDLANTAPQDELDIGDKVVDVTGNVKGYIEDIYVGEGDELYANISPNGNSVKLSALKRV